VGIVLFTAPPKGDASLKGDLLGFTAMMLWATYIATARYFRKDMDVVTFMASITPIAIITVLPLALVNGNMFDISATGWRYIALLTFVTGVAAHGLMVFAQKTIPIGTIGIAQVAQPALAALWSFLLVGETLRGSQLFGMVLVLGGLLSFVIMNQRRPVAPANGP
jgi:drug/metabolite transporter (DMT)-like permease